VDRENKKLVAKIIKVPVINYKDWATKEKERKDAYREV
jgi:hypothetical protein